MRLCLPDVPLLAGICRELSLDGLPQVLLDDGVMLARMRNTLMDGFSVRVKMNSDARVMSFEGGKSPFQR